MSQVIRGHPEGAFFNGSDYVLHDFIIMPPKKIGRPKDPNFVSIYAGLTQTEIRQKRYNSGGYHYYNKCNYLTKSYDIPNELIRENLKIDEYKQYYFDLKTYVDKMKLLKYDGNIAFKRKMIY